MLNVALMTRIAMQDDKESGPRTPWGEGLLAHELQCETLCSLRLRTDCHSVHFYALKRKKVRQVLFEILVVAL